MFSRSTSAGCAAMAGDAFVLSSAAVIDVAAAGPTRPRPPIPSTGLEPPSPRLKMLPLTVTPILLVPTPSERIGDPPVAFGKGTDAETEDELGVVVEV